MEAHTAIPVDPRVVAEALHMGTDDLARVLTGWANDAMPRLEYDTKWEPTALDYFDTRVAEARRLLVDAHAAQAAWEADNPAGEDDQ